MRIVMDLQGAQSESRYRGIGRYSLSLAMAVARNNRGHDIHLSLNGVFAESVPAIRALFEDVLPHENIHVWYAPMPVAAIDKKNGARRRRAALIKEAGMASLNPDVIHISSLFEGYVDDSVTSVKRLGKVPTVVTLYDMIPLMNPDIYLDPDPDYRSFYESKLEDLRRANALVVISESSSTEAIQVLGFDSSWVFNISAACDQIFRRLDGQEDLKAEVRKKIALEGDFILYTGGSDYRKNLMRLLDAYAGLAPELRQRYRLVFAGRMHAPHVEELTLRGKQLGLAANDLLFTGYVADEELVALYNECSLFVFPSWHEGFGLPVLEAMACGAAVLASNASSIKEVACNQEALFDPTDVDSIKERMTFFLSNPDALAALRGYSLERAADFSWENVAANFIDACEKIHVDSSAQTVASELAESLLSGIVNLGPMSDAELMAVADAVDRTVVPAVPKIMIDVSELAARDYQTGIQRVTRAIASEWAKSPPVGYQVQLVRIDREGGRYVCANEYSASLLGGDVVADAPLVCHAGDVFLGLDLVGDCVSFIPEWFDYFHATGVGVSFVVYDILPILHPEWWPAPGGQMHERWLRDVLRVSDRLICISKAVADDVSNWVAEHDVKTAAALDWFHLGADIDRSSPSRGMPPHAADILSRLSASTSFLMVGTLEPRKGHVQMLDAFEALWAQGHDYVLVVVGKKGWLVDALCERLWDHPQVNRNLFWLQGVSDEFLEQVYSSCTCLLAASEGEGFGLPLIEAAQRRMPILARDIPVFREVAGKYAYYFDGHSTADVARAIQDWVWLYQRNEYPRTDSFPWMTWAQSADQLADVLLRRPAKDRRLGVP